MSDDRSEWLVGVLKDVVEETVAAREGFKDSLHDTLLWRVRQYSGHKTAMEQGKAVSAAGCVFQRLYRQAPGPEFLKRHPLCAICPLRPAGQHGLRRGLRGCLYVSPQPF